MPTQLDHEFVRAAARAADRPAAPLAAGPDEEPVGVPHRALARRVKTLVAAYRSPESALHGSGGAVAAATTHLRALRATQTSTGLFAGGDNVQSPPDSAFTVNDVCDAHVLAAGAGPELDEVTAALAEIAGAASGSLLTGGVHTPNHRWELSAALARLHRSFPDGRLLDRVEEWLAEGVDIDAEGLYSERSANYAAHVSNPSLLLLAGVLGRADLLDAVERNLTATLDLIRPDGTVETVHSRRQDQHHPFPLAPYLPHYRLLAVRTGRGDFARAARLAAAGGIDDPDLLAETLLTPDLCRALPAPAPETLPRDRYVTTARLAARASATAHTVVYGGSDVPEHRRIRSGLACNPTFLRLFAGDAVLDAVRLSRGSSTSARSAPPTCNGSPTTVTSSPKPSRPPTTSRSRRTGGATTASTGWRTRAASRPPWPSRTGPGTRSRTRPGSRWTCGRTAPTCGSTSADRACPGRSNSPSGPAARRRAANRSATDTGA